MDFNVNEFLDAFIEETKDNLESFNEELIKLEKNKTDLDIVNNIFRVAHTLKGMAATMGYERMRSLTHTMEDLLSDARDGNIKVSTDLINLLFSCHDYLEKSLNQIIDTTKETEEEPHELIGNLKNFHDKSLGGSSEEVVEPVKEEVKEKKTKGKSKAKKVDEVEKIEDKVDEETITEEVVVDDESLHNSPELKEGFKVIVNINADCKLLVARIYIIEKTVEENSTIISSIPTKSDLENPTFTTTDFITTFNVKTDDIETLLDKINSIPEVDSVTAEDLSNNKIFEKSNEVKEDIASIINNANANNQGAEGNTDDKHDQVEGHHKVEEYLRIAASKVDNLADMVGELMIAQSLVEQKVAVYASDNQTMAKEMSRMSRLTKDIQTLSMSLRMVPLKSTLQKVIRTGRDTAQTLNKEINIEVIGEETEIDRTITEKLYNPLMHMVRNSIGHGIEDAEKRKAIGKDSVGNVTISAYNKRGSVYIEIEDDGAGLDFKKILNKAIEKGLTIEDKKYTDEEIANFIFLPGFSTADKIDSVSGRGVGMDVVRTEINKIGGSVKVDSVPGEGTKFTLKIPINLAIMNGTIVRIMNQCYILPTLNIREIVNVEDENWVSIKGKEKMLKVRGEVLPIYPIKKLLGESGFNITELEHDEKLMMIIELDDMVRAVPVQTVLERREIVVKSLDREFSNLDFISGASILGDGTVALIFDVEGLLKKMD